MSSFNDPRYLEEMMARASAGGLVEDKDRVCKGCRYDLTGLRYGMKCPECGRAISYGRAMLVVEHDRMQDAPLAYMRLVQFGFALLTVGWIGLPLTAAAAFHGETYFAPVRLGLTMCWSLGVAVLCLPRPSTPKEKRSTREHLHWRTGALFTQMLWVFAAVMTFTANPMASVPGAAARSMVIVAMLGMIATAWIIGVYAEWLQDADQAPKFRQRSFWFIGIFFVVLAGGALRISVPLPILSALLHGVDILPIILGVFMVLLLWSLVMLTIEVGWCRRAARDKLRRDAELRERRRRETEANQRHLQETERVEQPVYHSWKVGESAWRSRPDRG